MEIIITETNNSKYGSYFISYDLYNKIYEYYEYKAKGCNVYTRKVYKLGNMKMIVKDGESTVIKEQVTNCKVMDNLIIRIFNVKNINSNKFPVINEYESVTESNVIDLIFKNLTISFINENNNYSVVLNTNNKDTSDIKNTVSFILEELV
jgi:hypothetical protein